MVGQPRVTINLTTQLVSTVAMTVSTNHSVQPVHRVTFPIPGTQTNRDSPLDARKAPRNKGKIQLHLCKWQDW